MPETVVVTGCAGFIGYHVARRLLELGADVLGIDNMNAYYDVRLKEDRLASLRAYDRFEFERASVDDLPALDRTFRRSAVSVVVHLAAQAGIRYSVENPHAFVQSNVVGFMNVLECCRQAGVGHLLYASSSSVYGANEKQPFSPHDGVGHPVSIYAATKRANELMAHAYSHLYGLPTTGLRLFTVYGPWGRPDMAVFKFTRSILAGEPISIYNEGRMKRDFTYIDDVAEAIVRLVRKRPEPNVEWSGAAPHPDPATSYAPFRIYNVGARRPVPLLDVVSLLEEKLGVAANKRFMPMQDGDVAETYADVGDLRRDIGYEPATPIEEGIAKFVEWYKEYYGAIGGG